VRFSRKQQNGYVPNFFSRFKRKHLFITTYIEKQCTWPLNTRFHGKTLQIDILHTLLILCSTTQFEDNSRNKNCLKSDEATSSGQIGYLLLFTLQL